MVSGWQPPQPHRALDLKRMFIGEENVFFLVEIALRTTIIFVYALVLLRLLGKRGVAQLSLFEVTIIIGLGSAVGDPMFQADVPIVHSMLVIGIIVLLYRLFMTLLRRVEPFERFVEGSPSCVVRDGRVELGPLHAERLSQEELYEILRLAGIRQLGEVKRAYLEQSGQLSIFSFPPKEVIAGLPLVPPYDLGETPAVVAGRGRVGPGSYACRCCGEVTTIETERVMPPCGRCKHDELLIATTKPLGPDVAGVDV